MLVAVGRGVFVLVGSGVCEGVIKASCVCICWVNSQPTGVGVPAPPQPASPPRASTSVAAPKNILTSMRFCIVIPGLSNRGECVVNCRTHQSCISQPTGPAHLGLYRRPGGSISQSRASPLHTGMASSSTFDSLAHASGWQLLPHKQEEPLDLLDPGILEPLRHCIRDICSPHAWRSSCMIPEALVCAECRPTQTLDPKVLLRIRQSDR